MTSPRSHDQRQQPDIGADHAAGVKSFIRGRFGFLAFMIVCCVMFFGLGCWQVQRLAWKEQLLANLNHLSQIDPETILLSGEDFDQIQKNDIRRGTIYGAWLAADRTILVHGEILNGKPAHNVVVPVQIEGGAIVPVILGQAYDDAPVAVSNAFYTIPPKFHGIARQMRASSFKPENDLDKNLWYQLDVRDLSSYWGGNVTSAVFIVEDRNIDGITPIKDLYNLPNNHKQYAIFWFSMAGLIALLTAVYTRSQYNKQIV